jgi:C2 domain
MSSRGRVKQLEKIHAEISGGGSCFTTRALKKCIGQEVNTDMLPSSVYFSDFLDAFQGEITRLQDQEEYLKYQINQYKVKKRMHLAKYDEELATASINEKIMKDSKLSLIIEEARELPAMNTNNTADPFFTVKCDDKVVFQSPMISDTADPIWNSRFVIPILNKSHNIEVEVWDDEVTPEFIGSFVLDLDTYEDQQVHCRWYDLEGPEGISNGEVKVLGQWLYNLLTFHQMFIDKYEHLITINEKSLLLITQQINKLYSLDGIELLQAWLSPPPPPTISKNRRSQHFLSIPPSKNNSVIGSPKNSPKSRYVKPAAFSNFLAAKEFDKIRYESPLGYSSARPTHYSLDYFAIGMFVSNRIKLKK